MTLTSSAAVLNYFSDSREGDDYKQSAVKPEADTVRRCRPNDFMMATLFGTLTYGKETLTLQRFATNKRTADVINRINHKNVPQSAKMNPHLSERAIIKFKKKRHPRTCTGHVPAIRCCKWDWKKLWKCFCTDGNQIWQNKQCTACSQLSLKLK